MIGYILTGGIGDAILSLPVIEKISSILGEKVIVVCFDPLVIQIFKYSNVEVRYKEITTFDIPQTIYNILPDCSLAIWNRFEDDNDGFSSYFYALNKEKIDFVRKIRKVYYENLSKVIKRNVTNLKDEVLKGILQFFSSEENYYVDWNRFGIDVSYDDLNIPIPDCVVLRNKSYVESIGPYCIVHDSKMFSPIQKLKSWYPDRWERVIDFIQKELKIKVVHIHDSGQKIFPLTISHFDVIGTDAKFFDYLYLLSKAKFYVGTDSWPGHVAPFFPDVKFILLKGAVAKRWDHLRKYSTIIRKGNCQCCEYTLLEKCVFQNGLKTCMDKIIVEDVVNEIRKVV